MSDYASHPSGVPGENRASDGEGFDIDYKINQVRARLSSLQSNMLSVSEAALDEGENTISESVPSPAAHRMRTTHISNLTMRDVQQQRPVERTEKPSALRERDVNESVTAAAAAVAMLLKETKSQEMSANQKQQQQNTRTTAASRSHSGDQSFYTQDTEQVHGNAPRTKLFSYDMDEKRDDAFVDSNRAPQRNRESSDTNPTRKVEFSVVDPVEHLDSRDPAPHMKKPASSSDRDMFASKLVKATLSPRSREAERKSKTSQGQSGVRSPNSSVMSSRSSSAKGSFHEQFAPSTGMTAAHGTRYNGHAYNESRTFGLPHDGKTSMNSRSASDADAGSDHPFNIDPMSMMVMRSHRHGSIEGGSADGELLHSDEDIEPRVMESALFARVVRASGDAHNGGKKDATQPSARALSSATTTYTWNNRREGDANPNPYAQAPRKSSSVEKCTQDEKEHETPREEIDDSGRMLPTGFVSSTHPIPAAINSPDSTTYQLFRDRLKKKVAQMESKPTVNEESSGRPRSLSGEGEGQQSRHVLLPLGAAHQSRKETDVPEQECTPKLRTGKTTTEEEFPSKGGLDVVAGEGEDGEEYIDPRAAEELMERIRRSAEKPAKGSQDRRPSPSPPPSVVAEHSHTTMNKRHLRSSSFYTPSRTGSASTCQPASVSNSVSAERHSKRASTSQSSAALSGSPSHSTARDSTSPPPAAYPPSAHASHGDFYIADLRHRSESTDMSGATPDKQQRGIVPQKKLVRSNSAGPLRSRSTTVDRDSVRKPAAVANKPVKHNTVRPPLPLSQDRESNYAESLYLDSPTPQPPISSRSVHFQGGGGSGAAEMQQQTTPDARSSTHNSSNLTCLMNVTGAELFALLRLRGLIVSSGQTGENLLPHVACHSLQVTHEEAAQVRQLRDLMARAGVRVMENSDSAATSNQKRDVRGNPTGTAKRSGSREPSEGGGASGAIRTRPQAAQNRHAPVSSTVKPSSTRRNSLRSSSSMSPSVDRLSNASHAPNARRSGGGGGVPIGRRTAMNTY